MVVCIFALTDCRSHSRSKQLFNAHYYRGQSRREIAARRWLDLNLHRANFVIREVECVAPINASRSIGTHVNDPIR